jgi:acyl transferase domain-containing protein
VKGVAIVFVFSANDEQSLKNNTKSLARHLLNPAVSVDSADLAYSLCRQPLHAYVSLINVGS